MRLLLRALIFVVLAGWLVAGLTVGRALASGDGVKEALRSSSLLQAHRLRMAGGMDSWGPMWSGWSRRQALPGAEGSVYERSLRLDRCKFQYPPSSWLLLELLPVPQGLPLSCTDDGPAGTDIHSAHWAAKPWLGASSAIASLALIALSAALLLSARWRGFALAEASSPAGRALPRPLLLLLLWGAAILAGLGFYPLVKGHTLGQLQVFLNLALGAALLLWPRHSPASGVLVGLCSLFKPQYALFLLWGVLRRRAGFVAGLTGVAALGHGVALLRYGLDVHVHYLQWLQALSQVGEAFWANQSLNGLLNRLLQTADAIAWAPAAFPAQEPLVRWATVLGSVVLLAMAMWPPTPARHTLSSPLAASRLDFAAMLAALTIASPIAWEHHYGSFLPLFALLLGALAAQPHWPRRSAWVLGAAFVLMANAVLRPEWIFGGRLIGLAGSHLWLGAMLVFGLLLVWRTRCCARVTPPVAAIAVAEPAPRLTPEVPR